MTYNRRKFRSPEEGFTIIEILITAFVIGTVVTGLFGLFVLSLRTSAESERRIVGVALANEKMELVRNLPYVNVGTLGGVPAGSILQQENIVRNGVTYFVKTGISYVDDPYDGVIGGESEESEQITICHQTGSGQNTITVNASALDAHLAHGDSTGACGVGGDGTDAGDDFNADYKQVRVEVTWPSPNQVRPVLLVTHVAPQGIEGSDLGGTLDFQALNSVGEGVLDADVTIVNNEVSPTINIITQTNSEGRVVLPALPAGADSYQMSVSKDGYTTEETFDVTPTFIPDFDHSHLTMITKEITSKTFFIDLVSELNLLTQDDSLAAIPNVTYTLQGTKTIGVDDNSDPVYVLSDTAATDSIGAASYEGVVWDSYDIIIDGDLTGYDIKETSELIPIAVNPGEVVDVDVTLVPHTPLSLHVTVATAAGEPIDNATVHLFDGVGYDETLGTGVLGQVFFEDLPLAIDYSLEVSAPGYQASNQTVGISGSDRIRIELNP